MPTVFSAVRDRQFESTGDEVGPGGKAKTVAKVFSAGTVWTVIRDTPCATYFDKPSASARFQILIS
jgi:hypothetical protein